MNAGMSDNEVNVPENLNEAVSHLEKVLGTPSENNTKHFHINIDSCFEHRSEKNKPSILVENKGELIFGNPYIAGESIVFDVVESVKRKIYENNNDKPVLLEQPQRFLVARLSIIQGHQLNEPWPFDMVMVSHSIPKCVGRPYMKGHIKWLANGFCLIGIAIDSMYAKENRLLPVACHAVITVLRNDDQLSIQDHWQLYQLCSAPDGSILPMPDFDQPLGDGYQWLRGTGSW